MSTFKRLGTIADAIVAKIEPPRQFGAWPKPYSKETYASLKTNPEIAPESANTRAQRRCFRVGDRVYLTSDPRHIGIIKMISISARTCTIVWEDTGWLSFRERLADCRRILPGEDR